MPGNNPELKEDFGVANMRRLRHAYGWTALELERRCEKFALAHEPPIAPTLTRGRIAKLECGKANGLKLAEGYVLANVLGISLDELAGGRPTPSDTGADRVAERVAKLEHTVAHIARTLGISESPAGK